MGSADRPWPSPPPLPLPVKVEKGGNPKEDGRWLNVDNSPRHRCRLPGWWKRWRDGAGEGSRWECQCGTVWVRENGGWYFEADYDPDDFGGNPDA